MAPWRNVARALALATLVFATGCETIMTALNPTRGIIPRSALFDNPQRAQARISPDGRWISWLAPRDGVLNVWVAPASEPSQARPITADRSRGIQHHVWAPGSQHVLYLQDTRGDENFHVYAVDVTSAETRDLTPARAGVRATIQGLSRRRPGVVVVALNNRDREVFDLYEVDIATGARVRVAENPGFASWVVDHDLAVRLGVRQSPEGGLTLMRAEEGGAWTALTQIPADDAFTTQPIGFDGAGRAVYMTDSRGRDTAALTVLNVTSGETRALAQTDRADISQLLIHPTTREPIAFAAEQARLEWTAIDPAYAPDIAFLTEQTQGDFTVVSMTDDARTWIVHVDGPQQPGVYYRYEAGPARALTGLFDTRPALAPYTLAATRPVEIRARDGLTLVSYLTLPPQALTDARGAPVTPPPMVLLVHGGPWARDSYGFNAMHQWLANRGYAVLSVNYRGSRGFGKAFMNAAIGEFAGAMHEDLIDAVNWAVAEGFADPQRVAIAGGSYGGYAALVGLSFTPDTFACGVDIVGPSSLVTLVESFPPYWKPFLATSWLRFVGDPADVQQRADMLNRSPITRVDAITKPLLIGQGENDPRVTKRESDQLVAAMSERGLPVTYVNFPDEGHGFARPQNRLGFYAVMETFLAQCLGGTAEPVGAAFRESSGQILHGVEFLQEPEG